MAIVTIVYTLVVIMCMSLLRTAGAQSENRHDVLNGTISLNSLSKAVEDLNKVVEKLDFRIEMQWEFMKLLDISVRTQMTLLNNRMDNANSQALEMLELYKTGLDTLKDQSLLQMSLINMLITESVSQATSSNNNLTANEGIQATSFQNLSTNVQTLKTQVANVSTDFQESRSSQELLEGIVAGTTVGVVVIPLGLGKQKNISSNQTKGVAFDWSTRKIYWIDDRVGIRRSNLDGTSVELLIADTQELRGLAVDQITGNFYYGIQSPKQELRVCGRSGNNCAVIPFGADLIGDKLLDIALYPSEGIMFWSNFNSSKSIIRANMDGTDTKVIVSERSYGIGLDEASQRLYSADHDNRILTSYDLNGSNKKILLNATLSPTDVAVYGDTVYFGSWVDKKVYSKGITAVGIPFGILQAFSSVDTLQGNHYERISHF